MANSDRCQFCDFDEGIQRYAVTVDGVALSLAPLLCAEHGQRFLLRTGFVMGTLDQSIEQVFVAGAKWPSR